MSDNLVINFADIPSLEPLPAGTYDAEIKEAKPGQSKTGNPKLDIRWRVVEGDFEGRVIFDTLSFAPAALWRTKKTLMGLGYPDGYNGAIDAAELVGRPARISLIIEPGGTNPDTGEAYPERNRVSAVQTVLSSTPAPVQQAQKKSGLFK